MMVCKISFCSEFPDVLNKLWHRRKSRRRLRKATAKSYALQAYAKNVVSMEYFMMFKFLR